MDDAASVQCPYCSQIVELFVDPGTQGTAVEDCEVCCRPWNLTIERDEEGRLSVWVDRAQ